MMEKSKQILNEVYPPSHPALMTGFSSLAPTFSTKIRDLQHMKSLILETVHSVAGVTARCNVTAVGKNVQRPHATLQLLSAMLLLREVMSLLERTGEGGEGDLGRRRWGWGVFLADCIIKPLRQALSALSCLFSSLFATSRLSSKPACCKRKGVHGSESEVSRGEGKKQSNTSSALWLGK